MTAAFIADAWGLVRDGLQARLDELRRPARVLAATATEALSALAPGELLIAGLCPDASLESTVRRARAIEGVQVIALVTTIDRTGVLQLCAAGADAVLDRSARDVDLRGALATIATGHRHLAPGVLDVIFSGTPETVPRRSVSLSPREQAVLELLATGRSNRDIAAALHIGVETVKTHLSNVYVKLGVARRDQAIAAALRSGLL
jgi:DNA-binding NarL/FixJ family response regulator